MSSLTQLSVLQATCLFAIAEVLRSQVVFVTNRFRITSRGSIFTYSLISCDPAIIPYILENYYQFTDEEIYASGSWWSFLYWCFRASLSCKTIKPPRQATTTSYVIHASCRLHGLSKETNWVCVQPRRHIWAHLQLILTVLNDKMGGPKNPRGVVLVVWIDIHLPLTSLAYFLSFFFSLERKRRSLSSSSPCSPPQIWCDLARTWTKRKKHGCKSTRRWLLYLWPKASNTKHN